MNKKIQVVMLPTKQSGNTLIYRENRLMWQDKKSAKNDRKWQSTKYYHLYFLSDDEIKEGDWVITPTNDILQWSKVFRPNGKKVIATTEKLNTHPNVQDSYRSGNCLPQPSQEFIEYYVEQYNKGNIIEWVDVEYVEEQYSLYNSDLPPSESGHGFKIIENLLINQDNTVNISPIKDSWSKEEVVELINKFEVDTFPLRYEGYGTEQEDINQWISENLK